MSSALLDPAAVAYNGQSPARHILFALLEHHYANIMSKPSILLVPGASTPGHVYNNVSDKVAGSGYDS